MSLFFTTTPENLIVTGKTFYVKEKLKALGGIWKSPQWLLPLDTDSALMRDNLKTDCQLAIKAEKEEKKIKEAKRFAYLYSPQAVKDALKAKMAGDRSFYWICCDQCKVLDWERQYTSCLACGQDYGTHTESFFVRGRLRTGD